MTKTLLLLTLLLVAPVAGAYQGFHCKDCTLTDVHTNQDQPAEEAKEESIQEIIALGDKQCTGDFTPWFTPYFDGVHMTISIKCVPRLQAEKDEEDKQSDAEKWKELCDKFIEAVREGVYDQTPVNHMKERLDFANLLCTRYTAAILEEMRNK